MWVKSLLQTTWGWIGQRVLRWLMILIHQIYFPCMSSCFWSHVFMKFFCFFMRADMPNFFMSLRLFFIDHPRLKPIRLWPYHGCSSWVSMSFCFSAPSRIFMRDAYLSDDLAIENIRERRLYPTSCPPWCRAFLWFSSYTSRTKSVFFIFFFDSLDHDGQRSYNTQKIFFFSLEFMYLREIWWCWLSSVIYFLPEPAIYAGSRYRELLCDLCNRTMIFFCLLEYLLLDDRINLAKCSWHKNGWLQG